MKFLFAFYFAMLLLYGCSDLKVDVERLQLIDGKYYLANSSKPYSGEVIFTFDNGDISNLVEMKGGVPNGKWFAYGYKKEVIQEGVYKPLDLSNDELFFQDRIRRINICITKEGGSEFTDILLITDMPYDKLPAEKMRRIASLIKKSTEFVFDDTINQVKFVKGELSR
jgi:hypothetical protein